jgi:hypothetical protein
MIRIDSSALEIFISHGANNYLGYTNAFIQFYYDDSQCNFIKTTNIPLELEVCGGERVIVTDQTLLETYFESREDANSYISNLTSLFIVPEPTKCVIIRFYLVSYLDPEY